MEGMFNGTFEHFIWLRTPCIIVTLWVSIMIYLDNIKSCEFENFADNTIINYYPNRW